MRRIGTRNLRNSRTGMGFWKAKSGGTNPEQWHIGQISPVVQNELDTREKCMATQKSG